LGKTRLPPLIIILLTLLLLFGGGGYYMGPGLVITGAAVSAVSC
jgi:hypothetical protein